MHLCGGGPNSYVLELLPHRICSRLSNRLVSTLSLLRALRFKLEKLKWTPHDLLVDQIAGASLPEACSP